MDRLCTIIAQNYMPQAMALLESTREIYPDIEFYVLITDATSRMQPLLESAQVLLPTDLDIDPEWLADMQSYYDPVEFATSLKPFLLSTLLTPSVSTVTFLDPDILLFSELTQGFAAAKISGIALSPHRLTPAEIKGKKSGELSFLKYGVFNLGYICVGQLGKPMLEWWGARLRWFCTRFPNDVIFTDQKWMDLVPALFTFSVIRNFGYDVAPWNINERKLFLNDKKLFAANDELVFIHFSQMSSGLAAGNKTQHWQDALQGKPEFAESLKLISKITDAYSEKLVAFRREISANSTPINNWRTPSVASFHHRQRMIKRSWGIQSKKRLISNNSSRHFRGMLKTLERSATLNGLRLGLESDLTKMSQRLRNFFHK
jgi:hypothetical protein